MIRRAGFRHLLAAAGVVALVGCSGSEDSAPENTDGDSTSDDGSSDDSASVDSGDGNDGAADTVAATELPEVRYYLLSKA